MRNLTYLIIIGILLSSFVSSITFEKEIKNNVIVPQYNQPAEIILTISNNSKGEHNIYTLTSVDIFPKESFKLSEGKNEIIVQIFPMKSLSTRGFYTFIYYLRDFNGINHEDKMTVKVVDLKDLIEISSEANYPGEEMRFFVKNKENAKLTDLNVKFKSIFFEINKEFDLAPLETKVFTVGVDREKIKKIPAGSYLLEAEFNVDSGESLVDGKIFFGESKQILTDEKLQGFFIRSESIKKINSGNTIETVKITFNRNIIFSSFTFFSEKPSEVERSGLVTSYSWTKKINPSEVIEIEARTNYLVPLLILVIILGTIFTLSRYNTTRLEIKKSVAHIKTKGGEFALRVRVHIKAHKNLDNVSITERIPAIAKVHENFGGMKPSSINLKERKLQWSLGSLQGGEERLFSYVIYSKVGVIGKFSIPESIAIFEEDGKICETFSNKAFFLSEQIKRLE
jgi:hypothetical protein